MPGDQVETFTVEARKAPDDPKRSDIDYFLMVLLPDEIKYVGVDHGSVVNLKLEKDVVDGDSLYFIHGNTRGLGRHELKVRRNTQLASDQNIRIPKEYTHNREGQSFYGLDVGDELVVELDYEAGDGFRVYTQNDYQLRLQQLSEDNIFPKVTRPVVGFLASKLVPEKWYKNEYMKINTPSTISPPPEGAEVGSYEVKLPGLEKVVLQNRLIRYEDDASEEMRRRDTPEKEWNDSYSWTDIDGDYFEGELPGEISYFDSGKIWEERLKAFYRDGVKISDSKRIRVE
jgi:hypothetical protein